MLYNKYRPTRLDQIIGQRKIVEILRYEAEKNKFSHAYLFYGHRGTGKTTIARILKKMVNCQNPSKDGPCGECEECKQQNNTDFIELDGASNNGVDQIRELVDSTKYKPMISRKKVYVIDEVHMLSTAAFNALLKTLEEPPESCVFILCTTELHKIPLTIKSRCETHFFESISVQDMVEHMEKILEANKISFEKEALNLIAKNADGSMRDALSILEQMMVCSNDGIHAETIRNKLSLISEEVADSIIYDAICNKTKDLLKNFDKIYQEGKSLSNFLDTILNRLSELIIRKIEGEANWDEDKFLLRKTTVEKLFWLIEQFTKLREEIRKEVNPYLLFYLKLIQISHTEILQDDSSYLVVKVAELQERVKKLEKRETIQQAEMPMKTEKEDKEQIQNKEEREGGIEEKNREPERKQDSILAVEVENEIEDENENPFGDLFNMM